MTAELGTKRTCPNCGAKYYDLNHDPIVCPRCGTPFEIAGAKARPQTAAPAPVEKEEEAEPPAPAAEVVSFEEADEEATADGKVAPAATDDDSDDEEEEIEGGENETFLAEEDEEEEDVGNIIGEVDEDDT